jgi:hypothetical protein
MSPKRSRTTRVNDAKLLRRARTYDMSAIARTRRGEGGKDSTLDVAKAIANYASS